MSCLNDPPFIEVMAYEVLNTPSKSLSQTEDDSFCLIITQKLRGVARIDEILQFTTFQQFVATHEVEVDLVLFPLTHQKLPENLYFRQILDAFIE